MAFLAPFKACHSAAVPKCEVPSHWSDEERLFSIVSKQIVPFTFDNGDNGILVSNMCGMPVCTDLTELTP